MKYIDRNKLLESLSDSEMTWEIIIIGGGATGLGTALDAATRGYKTLLLEQHDFAKGTSSRSTKLVHGGVRYLAQGNIRLVREALRERGLLLKNAPHLAKNVSFIIPCYSRFELIYYSIGLAAYDLLAGRLSLGKTKRINKSEVVKRLPGINSKQLQGGIVYHDGQFDDARLAVNLAQTCLENGATVLNYTKVIGLLKSGSSICGVLASDTETGKTWNLRAKVVINATGVFVDEILQLDRPGSKHLIKPSQGVHLVLERSFMPSVDALMIPKTDDGRVLFAVPWHDKLVIGTTDTPLNEHSLEPVALESEIAFILKTASGYLERTPTRNDVLSVFAGLRPLAAPGDDSSQTKEISRSHRVLVAESGLISVIGGKWTTYRQMAEDTMEKAIAVAGLDPVPCKTANMPVHGSVNDKDWNDHLYIYGSDREKVLELINEQADWAKKIHPNYPYIRAEVIWAVRYEMAQTVEDVLARRVRLLFVDARAAIAASSITAQMMARELGRDENWQNQQVARFTELANNYLLQP